MKEFSAITGKPQIEVDSDLTESDESKRLIKPSVVPSNNDLSKYTANLTLEHISESSCSSRSLSSSCKSRELPEIEEAQEESPTAKWATFKEKKDKTELNVSLN